MGLEHRKGGLTVDCNADWNQIRTEYLTTKKASYRSLAKKYDIPLATLSRVAKDEGWYELKKQIDDKVSTNVGDIVAENQTKCATYISDTTVALLKQMADEVVKNSLTSASAAFYKDAADALRKFKDVAGVKNPKDIEEQQARIDNLRKQAQKDDTDNDKTIKVEYNGMEAYSE